MKLLSNILFQHKFQAILIVIIFYVVGVLGIGIRFTHLFFIALIPYVLLLSFAIILYSHKTIEFKKDFFVFSLIYLVSYLVEVVGVNSHLLFGNYTYGDGLGFKVFETPLLIGINWVMLVFCSASILEWTRWPSIVQAALAPLLMVVYDLVLEQVAPLLNMWSWHENSIPVQNFVTWFIMAASFHVLLKVMKVKTINPFASVIFICQFLFFLVIRLFFK